MKALLKAAYDEKRNEESVYARAAAEWVAEHNRNTLEWASNHPDAPLLDAGYITDVTFAHVGAYAYSEMTYDLGDTGISYTFWEPRTVSRGKDKGLTKYYPVGMEIRWYEGMSAGTFIEECVALLNVREGEL